VYLADDIGGEKANRAAVRAKIQAQNYKIPLTEEAEELLENKLVREANRVALKVMTKLDQFERELTVRGHTTLPDPEKNYTTDADGCSNFDDAHVVNVIRSHKVHRLEVQRTYSAKGDIHLM
jgi:hypothetical protein